MPEQTTVHLMLCGGDHSRPAKEERTQLVNAVNKDMCLHWAAYHHPQLR